MDWQFVVSTLLVIGCAAYAVRNLLPSAWRFGTRGAAAPKGAIGACGGCTGCRAGAGAGRKPAATESVIRIVPRQAGRDAAR